MLKFYVFSPYNFVLDCAETNQAARHFFNKTGKSYLNPLMDSREKTFKSVLVYNKPIKDEGIKKLARFQGIWISEIPQHTSPTELWFYDLGEEPKQSSSSRLQGSWGFRPGIDGNFTA